MYHIFYNLHLSRDYDVSLEVKDIFNLKYLNMVKILSKQNTTLCLNHFSDGQLVIYVITAFKTK